MHTSRTTTDRSAATSLRPLIAETDEDPGGQIAPLIVRSTVETRIASNDTTGLLTRRRKRDARRAGRHG